MVSAGHVGGSGIVSGTADVLWMSVVRRMMGVGAVYEMCMCLARGGEGVNRFGLGLYQSPVEAGPSHWRRVE